ncbi:helix-hairpin-helix domain-containing protein [Pseudomonas kuykendallii]|uniref:Competence protein ComEA n=1 Tax=Pseudomonas kuykendallii TaxID=1007099 RepID=A0A1H3GCN5_9PSED|nr:helix-hairpin-helix domain-containing protein [Pseudomonas kuykendallii]MCQ4271888.1 helix-hairpin-helix domain-containing protein [Pseudomonas kuykendallii]SDY00810.1 competence protein ComEA [Pseudomonas kuykendallii]
MRKWLSALSLATLTSLSFSLLAAEPAKPAVDKPVVEQAAKVASVNLNTADAETLQRELSGIGLVKAKAIVAYREAHGPFASVDELLEVKGIGAATLDKNRSKLSL